MNYLKRLFSLLCNERGAFLNDLTTTILTNAIPTHWDAKIRIDSARKAFWGKFVGKEGSDMPIIERADFTQEPGNQININIASQLLQEGVTGVTTLENSEETYTLGQISITPDVLRHAVAINWKAKKQINYNAIMGIGDQLSSWMARRLDEDTFQELLSTHAPETIYAGNASSQQTLGSDDVFGIEEINRIKAALQRKGALPIRTIMDGKQEVDWYGIVISEIDEYQLKLDPIWNNANNNAGPRSYKENRLFSGAVGYWNGVWVYSHSSVKFGGRLGSYLRPEAQVTTQLSAGATTLTVGTNASVNYTKFFPSTGTLLIDQEQIAYTGKTVTTFTGLTRGANGTTAAIHLVNALVTLNNVSNIVGFGAEIQARAWGLYPTRITDVRDYGFEQGIGIMSYYGQRTIEDSAGNKPNCIIMQAYSPNPNTV